MSKGTLLTAERTNYTDAETGRKVTLWTAPGAGHNVGFYYHQNPFDARRNLVYFVSNRTGSWQLWRADLGDGRIELVSDLPNLGWTAPYVKDETPNQHAANYCYISHRSGQIYLSGFASLAVIDPDTLECRILRDADIPEIERGRRWYPNHFAFPSCDDCWVYSYSVNASRDEMAAAQTLAKAACDARKAEGRRIHGQYPMALPGMTESPLEFVIFRVEVASGRVEELWRGNRWIQHVMPSPTAPDLVSFLWAGLKRPKPKYFLMRAGEAPRCLVDDEINRVLFHDFWHPNGRRWLIHGCENLEPDPEIYAPIPGKMRFFVRDVDVAHFTATGEVNYRDWIESAGEKHVHLHLNIAPDGSFLVGDGQSDCPFICRLDWKDDGTIPATPLCRTGYATESPDGMEASPNVHVAPDGKTCFFTMYRDGKACLASVET